MHNELRYQSKTHAISEKLSKEKNKNSASSSLIFFFVEKWDRKKNNDMVMEKEMTSIPRM
jgi:FMN-dependent NADH-azoreductase